MSPFQVLLRRYYGFLFVVGACEFPAYMFLVHVLELGRGLSAEAALGLQFVAVVSAQAHFTGLRYKARRMFSLWRHLGMGIIVWGVGFVVGEYPIRWFQIWMFEKLPIWTLRWSPLLYFVPLFLGFVYLHNRFKYQVLDAIDSINKVERQGRQKNKVKQHR